MQSPSGATDFFLELTSRVKGELRVDDMSRTLYSTDASMYQIMPRGVLIPKSVDDIHEAVDFGRKNDIPLLARGGGSSLAGQAVGSGLVLDLTRWLDQVVSFDSERGKVVVQPGIVLDRTNAFLRPHGWMVGPDPASSDRATIGGMVGNNATGTHSILYGSIVDHTASVQMILADGSEVRLGPVGADSWSTKAASADLFDAEARIIRELDQLLAEGADVIQKDTPKHWRRSGGYRLERLLQDGPDRGPGKEGIPGTRNLAHLVCGSEGTLGIATEITLDLVRRPKMTALGIVHFRTRMESLEAVPLILETEPSAIELFDRHGIDQCRKNPSFAHRLTFVEGDPEALLLTEYYGETVSELKQKLDRLSDLSHARKVGYTVVALTDPLEIANVWDLRKGALGLILGVKGDFKPLAFIEDAAVPPENLASYIGELQQLWADTDTDVAMYAHASAGCLHIRPFINTKDSQEVLKMHEIAEGSMRLVKKYGGALSSEHGEGLARSCFAEEFYGQDLYSMYRRVKDVFDPGGIMNPGKIIDAPPMTENLRLGPDYAITALPMVAGVGVVANLDFSEDKGFHRSVELCSGIGTCRKLDGGTMCPSFMVTREEKHSTRGRANALRSAMQGTLGPDGFTSDSLYDVMSLCLSCKACKTECQSAVDMAKLKFEWLDHYWKKNRMPFRERLFANMPRMARRYSGVAAPFVNALLAIGSMSGLAQRAIGVSTRRKLPGFSRVPLSTWARRHQDSGNRDSSPESRKVALFADTFNNYQESHVGIAAVQLLERLGYDVEVVDGLCCGRTYMSKGLVDESRRLAEHVVERLFPAALKGVQIVGLEPSCILSLRDEYGALIPNDPRVELVAEHAVTLEEFVVEQAELGNIRPQHWAPHGGSVMVHGHCHQKSLIGMEPARSALELAGFNVEILDSGCCGMAGSFGYEREHYDWSLKMAERVLAPAVREAQPETLIVAAGTSCRHQIADVTGRRALHPSEVLLGALA
jgi:FAD/FMN-containing dehydrogenase/Fe-S oxidoreductase